jgi:hypothetical protein
MCFKYSRRLLSLSSTIVSWIAIYVVFLLTSIIYLFSLVSPLPLLPCYVWCYVCLPLDLLAVLSGRADIPIVLILCVSRFEEVPSLAFWALCCAVGFILLLQFYYCKNYFIYQVDTCIRPNILNIEAVRVQERYVSHAGS